ncbi:DMT family transporter [Rhizobium sp. SSA_523]|uniref:DMT family transporter n=1 Tax=Rhizobium sp. SSA_523 TaxID=2952477 RepID=UPI0020904F6D|nr:DMT family transporter [Rhizobium sp. SSA_523]MCO5730451.1 DMT family transporter [Rhizobium sp. SSA_523]WKC25493.1 DMT family transporter [Rhizobium sp. SSA_523]
MKDATDGWISGLLGVVIFSGSLPATRIAVTDLSPLFLTSARAVIAAVLAGLLLSALRRPRPAVADLPSLLVIALGVVVGFPLLTALALQSMTSARSIVFIGLLPLATAVFGVIRGGERPRPLFWIFALAGSGCVAGFALVSGGGGALSGDILMILAILVCGLGYAEGARLSRRLGGWQVICWSLIVALPLMAAIALATIPGDFSRIGAAAWGGLAYVSVFSMLIGFVFWYRGLALGGTASVGQLQLLQPFFGLLLSALLLGEAVSPAMLAVTLVTVALVTSARRFAHR